MAKKANHGLRFTGGDHLTPKDGFKYYLHQAMMVNELRGGYGAYEMSNAVNGSSGPSFGGIQFDVGSNKNGQKLLEKILHHAKDNAGNSFLSESEMTQLHRIYKPFNDVKTKDGKIATRGMSDEDKAFYKQIKPKLDAALSSPTGIKLINENYTENLDDKILKGEEKISNVKNKVNREFLNNSMQAKVFIADIGNQYGAKVNEALVKFIAQTEKDNGVTLPGNRTVKVHGQLDMEDLKNFRMSTVYGIKHPADAKRRDENIERITAPTRQQEHSKSSEGNDRPADKLQALIQGFKNDKDGTFTAKALADNADVVANFRDELRETLKQNQAQEVAQNTPQVQEERSYGGRSFS